MRKVPLHQEHRNINTVGADALCQDHIGNTLSKDMGNTLRRSKRQLGEAALITQLHFLGCLSRAAKPFILPLTNAPENAT